MAIELIDNINQLLGDNLKRSVSPGENGWENGDRHLFLVERT